MRLEYLCLKTINIYAKKKYKIQITNFFVS